MSDESPDFIAFKARYSYGANDRALHTHTPLGFYVDGWQDGRKEVLDALEAQRAGKAAARAALARQQQPDERGQEIERLRAERDSQQRLAVRFMAALHLRHEEDFLGLGEPNQSLMDCALCHRVAGQEGRGGFAALAPAAPPAPAQEIEREACVSLCSAHQRRVPDCFRCHCVVRAGVPENVPEAAPPSAGEGVGDE